jgi:glycosyltransferase involved in cell wall biosynthesis
MQRVPLPTESSARGRFIYVACPWSPAGGGMFKVADYLISAQHQFNEGEAATLRPLDTRGPGSAVASLLFLALALLRILRGRLAGRLAGVHVNMAERMSIVRKGSVVVTCWLLRVPVIIHLHGEMRTFYRRLPAPVQRLTRWMFSLASGVVVIGATGRRFVTEELGVRPERIDVVENGVPGPATAPVRIDPAARDVHHVLFIGRMCDAKGVVDLLEGAARAHANGAALRLTFAGGGSEIGRYTQLASSLGIAGITQFAGWCDEQDVRRLLCDASVLVLPSHDEVLPLVVLEALAHGVPVICTPVGELPHVFEDGVHVRFVPVRDPEALGAALQATLADAALLRTLGANGRRTYEERFSMSRFFARIARVHGLRFGTSAGGSAAQAGSEVNA